MITIRVAVHSLCLLNFFPASAAADGNFRELFFSRIFLDIIAKGCVGSRFEFAFVNICACKKGSCATPSPPRGVP